jgi:hypothetical protein
MDRTNEGAKTAPHTPPATSVSTMRVTPENVVKLAVLFCNAVGHLEQIYRSTENALRLSEPWMADEASKWMRRFFQMYFVEDENSFLRVLKAIYSQHEAHANALKDAAALYGKTDELNAALANQLQSQLPR